MKQITRLSAALWAAFFFTTPIVADEIQSDGTPKVTWEPDTPELRATREYTTYGRKSLSYGDWTPVTDADKDRYNFFKVEVRMK